MTETVIVHPEPPENQKLLAQELLGLADDFRDVEFVMWPEPGFRIPEELFARFLKMRTEQLPPSEESLPVKESEAEKSEAEENPEPVKRKPGRPKKIQEGQ